MTINGKEVEFKGTVGAMIDISEMCKDHDLKNAEALFEGASTADTLRNASKFIVALSNGALTMDDMRALSIFEVDDVLSAALDAFKRDREGQIRVEPTKKG